MNYIVFDLEWNQSPGGKADSVEHLPFEIIEIGAVKLDSCLQELGQFHRLIQPQVYREMHFKSSEVTHMDIDRLLKEGVSFPEAMKAFMEWCGEEEFMFCTWGSMDLTELQRNMAYYGLEISFPVPLLYYDIQKLYCLQHGDGKNRISLDLAVQLQHMEADRPFHRALDDAHYTKCIFAALDMEAYGAYFSVDYYRLPSKRGEEFMFQFPEYSKFVSREFETREDIMKDKAVTDVVCVKCKRMLRKKIRWFPYGQRFYLCIAVCPEHGYIRGKIRVKRSEDENYYAVKTIRTAWEGDVQQLLQKREDVRRRRSTRNRRKHA